MTNKAIPFGSDLLFEVYVNQTNFRGLSVGYELNEFRYEALTDLIFDALPDFALTYKEKITFGVANCRQKMRRAAKLIYQSDKYKKRGEFGEILLHAVMRDYFGSIPAISKMYYKDGSNETVKGFDAVHIVPVHDDLELWLGEVKFYNSISNAIRDVVKELNAHTNKDYLRDEFLFISNKIDDSWPFAQKLKDLIDEKTTLDKVFSRLRIPVLLTYDSQIVRRYRQACNNYKKDLIDEIHKHHDTFRKNNLPKNIEIVLILIPLEEKAKLVDKLHKKLKVWQEI
ncbi:DUF1837 domain-containing protein [Aneurinibacillus thermoaerophilus]|uniref:HamA C-terminal domain-containing protein n=1 Tax=Aneurinibacillus thermoaerophilus TaxID=143495 RepID=UPI002E1EEF9E|nr:DUF1837 domain-containing protein [Aneurinibacillus thermoaerophilus]